MAILSTNERSHGLGATKLHKTLTHREQLVQASQAPECPHLQQSKYLLIIVFADFSALKSATNIHRSIISY